jgi:EAL domain-containing protein (putative c-di-GMP-specific phosphodiesterase class I)
MTAAVRRAKKVLAEGVECSEQMAFLKQEKCDELQGYRLGRPLTAKAFESLLNNL